MRERWAFLRISPQSFADVNLRGRGKGFSSKKTGDEEKRDASQLTCCGGREPCIPCVSRGSESTA